MSERESPSSPFVFAIIAVVALLFPRFVSAFRGKSIYFIIVSFNIAVVMPEFYSGLILANGFIVSPMDTIDEDFLREQE